MGSFYQSKTKILPQDKYFSEYIRRRDNRCVFKVKCRGAGHWDWKHDLHCCHFFGRGKWSVRFDPENADAGCRACHLWLDSEAEGKQWHKEFKRQQLGQYKYDLLEYRKNQVGKKNSEAEKLWTKHLLSTLENIIYL